MSNTYVQIVKSRPVLSSVIDDQELDSIPEKLLDRIDVQTTEGTEPVRITAEGRSPEEARDRAAGHRHGLRLRSGPSADPCRVHRWYAGAAHRARPGGDDMRAAPPVDSVGLNQRRSPTVAVRRSDLSAINGEGNPA